MTCFATLDQHQRVAQIGTIPEFLRWFDAVRADTGPTARMHDLEEKVKPFLKPLLVNTHGADLDLTQQRDLARWAVMKVLPGKQKAAARRD